MLVMFKMPADGIIKGVNVPVYEWGTGEQEISGVHYTDLITPLIKAVQDQKKEIDALKEEITLLKSNK